jgi:hypothetical protein
MSLDTEQFEDEQEEECKYGFHDDQFHDPEDSEEAPCSDSFLLPLETGQFREVYFGNFSQENFSEFNLATEVGWVHAFLAIEGFDEWKSANHSDFALCARLRLLLQCIAIMLGNSVQSAFRNTVKSFLFVLACWTWAEFSKNFVDLEQWMSPDGSHLTLPFAKADVKKATKACNLIASVFKRTRDDLARLASNPIVLELLELSPSVSLLPEESSRDPNG